MGFAEFGAHTVNRFIWLTVTPVRVLPEPAGAGIAARVDTMNALAGLAALVIAMVGCALLAETSIRAEHAALIENSGQSDDLPPYIHFGLDDWRVS